MLWWQVLSALNQQKPLGFAGVCGLCRKADVLLSDVSALFGRPDLVDKAHAGSLMPRCTLPDVLPACLLCADASRSRKTFCEAATEQHLMLKLDIGSGLVGTANSFRTLA